MILLSDGTVMAQQAQTSSQWYKLTPDSSGNYADGTWTQLKSMSLARQYFGSVMLTSGQYLVVGGEYSGPSGAENDTNTGEVFDPTANSGQGSWSPIATFPQGNFGDEPMQLLPDGRVLTGGGAYRRSAGADYTWIYDPSANKWSYAAIKVERPGPNGTTVYDSSDEESWVKLADGSILTYDNWASNTLDQFLAERYIPSQNQWVNASTLDPSNPPGLLSDSSYEIGAATLLPDGRAFFLGTTGNTAFYNSATNVWTAGPKIPDGCTASDSPGRSCPMATCCSTPSTRNGIISSSSIPTMPSIPTPT